MGNDMSRGAGSGFAGKNFDIKKIIEWLGFILKCPICGHKYNLEKTNILESEQNEIYSEAHILIHSDCTKCKGSVMFNVDVKGPEVFSVGMVTDLTGQDSARFQKLEPISSNEVLGIHQALKTFKGDFITSFVQK